MGVLSQFSSCCAEELLAKASFFDGNMTKLDVTYSDLGHYLAQITEGPMLATRPTKLLPDFVVRPPGIFGHQSR